MAAKAKKKTADTAPDTVPEDKENTALAVSPEDMMTVAEAPAINPEDAGLGAEDIDPGDIILPRISILQGLSPAVMEERAGALAGLMWMTPHDRPVSTEDNRELRFVPVRVYPAQRRWRPMDEGGGLLCSAERGDLMAREANGLAGAKLIIDTNKKGDPIGIDWEDGTPTDDCKSCVYGPAAAAAAAGKAPTSKGNPWLPKLITQDGEQLKIPDENRAPKCTNSIDVLALVAIPGANGLPTSIEPAFLSFSRTSQSAGRQLAGMVKLAQTEPAWGKIYTLGAKRVSNDKGTFYVATVSQMGYAQAGLMDMAKGLYTASRTTSYRADMSDSDDLSSDAADKAAPQPRDDEAAPSDAF